MVVCVCRSKIRKNNAIEAYLLEDSNGATKTIKADKLKKLIRSGDVYVLNLNLYSDNRLISAVNQNKHARCCMFEICKKLRFKFSESGVKKVAGTYTYTASQNFLGENFRLDIEIKNKDISVNVHVSTDSRDLFDMRAIGTEVSIKLDYIAEVIKGFSTGIESYKKDVYRLLRLCDMALNISIPCSLFEEDYFRLFDDIVNKNGMFEQAKGYFKPEYDKIMANPDYIKGFGRQLQGCTLSNSISVNDIVAYCLMYPIESCCWNPDLYSVYEIPRDVYKYMK